MDNGGWGVGYGHGWLAGIRKTLSVHRPCHQRHPGLTFHYITQAVATCSRTNPLEQICTSGSTISLSSFTFELHPLATEEPATTVLEKKHSLFNFTQRSFPLVCQTLTEECGVRSFFTQLAECVET